MFCWFSYFLGRNKEKMHLIVTDEEELKNAKLFNLVTMIVINKISN